MTQCTDSILYEKEEKGKAIVTEQDTELPLCGFLERRCENDDVGPIYGVLCCDQNHRQSLCLRILKLPFSLSLSPRTMRVLDYQLL